MLYHQAWKKRLNGARNSLGAEQMQHFHQESLEFFLLTCNFSKLWVEHGNFVRACQNNMSTQNLESICDLAKACSRGNP